MLLYLYFVSSIPLVIGIKGWLDDIIRENASIITPKKQPPTRSPVCFKCGAPHYVRDCRILVCKHCGLNHQPSSCSKSGQKTFCSKCKSNKHNLEGHFKFIPEGVKLRPQNINVIEPEPTSFLEGAISMVGNHSGKSFIWSATGASLFAFLNKNSQIF